jgi:hypothetical protein
MLPWCTEDGKIGELLAFISWLKFLYEKLCLLQIYDRDLKNFAAHYQEMLQSEKQQGENQKEMGSDMQFWRLLHNKRMPWPCIVNSLKKNFASTCLCFHSGNHKSITLGRQTCVPWFMCGMVVWWAQEYTSLFHYSMTD